MKVTQLCIKLKIWIRHNGFRLGTNTHLLSLTKEKRMTCTHYDIIHAVLMDVAVYQRE